jgi:hypothetical protein
MEYKYDITLSFAGEDREYVERVAEFLIASDVKVFYDRFEEAELWGKDLGIHFEFVYRRSAKYCIPFISKDYKDKLWTNYEIRNAISRAIETKEDYILPARFDDTEIDGLRSTLGFIDLRKYEPEEFAKLILRKLQKETNEPIIQKEEKEPEKISNIYLSQNLLISDFAVQGVSLGVTITNLTKDYRYYSEPYFKLSNGLEGKYDTFFLTDRMEYVQFPLKMEWGQLLTVNYKLKPAGIVHWKDLPTGTTIKAIVTSTIGEKFESNEIELEKIINSVTNNK